MTTTTTATADEHVDDAALIAAVLAGPGAFALYVGSDDGDVHDRLWDLLEQAQDLAAGNKELSAAVDELVDVFWPPKVRAEDVFDIAGLYGVDEDTDPLDLAVA